jgi:hypothetical protein
MAAPVLALVVIVTDLAPVAPLVVTVLVGPLTAARSTPMSCTLMTKTLVTPHTMLGTPLAMASLTLTLQTTIS